LERGRQIEAGHSAYTLNRVDLDRFAWIVSTIADHGHDPRDLYEFHHDSTIMPHARANEELAQPSRLPRYAIENFLCELELRG
jgi:hypothetical protein